MGTRDDNLHDDLSSFPMLQSNPAAPMEDESAAAYATQVTRNDVTNPADTAAIPDDPAAPSPPNAQHPASDDAPTSHTLSAADVDADAAAPTLPHAPPPPARSATASRVAAASPASLADPDGASLLQLIEAGVLVAPDEAARARGTIAILDKRYELKKKLGEGGMGIVYLAFDKLGDCEVAVKTLRPKFLNDEPSRKQFIDEAKQMNKVPSHAHVLVVKGFGTENRPYYVMENMSGGSLGKLIRTQGPLPKPRVIQIASDIAKAIEYLHESSGQIHRDIKPENVLLAKDGSAWLCDFGLIRRVGIGAQGLRAGTLAYMPPEVVSDLTKNVAFDWDIYSFGAVLYEMLCGKRPYDELFNAKTSPIEQMKLMKEEVLKRPPLPIQEIHRAADPLLVRISQWCMAREARERYYRMSDVVADLERARQGQKPLGPRQTAEAKPAAGNRRSHVLVSILILLLVAVAVIGLVNPMNLRNEILTQLGLADDTPTGPLAKSNGTTSPGNDGNNGSGANNGTGATGTNTSTVDKTKDGQVIVTPTPVNRRTSNKILDAVNPAPPFKVHINTEQQRTLFVEGEVVSFNIRADKACHLIVLMVNLDHGEEDIVQLLPSQWQRSGAIEADRPIRVPSQQATDQDRIVIRIHPPHGQILIKVIATTKPVVLVDTTGFIDSGFQFYADGDIQVKTDEEAEDSWFELSDILAPTEWSTAELILTTRAP